jgi:hypothetical protein
MSGVALRLSFVPGGTAKAEEFDHDSVMETVSRSASILAITAMSAPRWAAMRSSVSRIASPAFVASASRKVFPVQTRARCASRRSTDARSASTRPLVCAMSEATVDNVSNSSGFQSPLP